MTQLLTAMEVEKLLAYPQGRAARLARAGLLPSIVLPDGELRFRQADIEALINRTAPTADRPPATEGPGNG